MAGQKTDERDVLLGQRIAEQRKRSRLTQRAVADSFGMSAAQLQKYEKGVNRISAIHLAVFSRMTGTPISEFLDGIPHPDEAVERGFAETPQPPLVAEPWSNLARAFARQISESFSEEQRRDISAAIEAFGRELKG
ncbi:transcriptional regulator with XRE-family HTH domain [Methylorubrum rhodinum]|jgi:transcriptional regulator with XRE-family HTH domain|uniref:Transcriptional regulator with XRE-family HTH domain n=1 Tax=Methylorubrum rhodinum TaxID=29428 RepID=A0A840ZEV9_9HYPH|nr:helix-turn-helix transcriptional regulator [Methylorubrum rhodinum]MBB5756239.1 transcriptional regulator with XRE-family HTH domain [Methylorubrum rhodinum]